MQIHPIQYLTVDQSSCIFCRIINGESPSTIIFQDDLVVAFLDNQPAAPVHILLVPRKHITSINEIENRDEVLIGRLFTIAKRLAAEYEISESGYRLIINSGPDARQTVFHIHLHLLGGRQMRYPMG